MVNNPIKLIKTARPERAPGEQHPKSEDYPAGRALKDSASASEPVLTANMTGQVTLSGNTFELQFNKGHLRGISHTESGSFLRIGSKSYFETSIRKSEYRNESAFALDAESEYGLRSIQIAGRNKNIHRIITDFFFNRETGICYIVATIEYPEFAEDEMIAVSAPVELRLRLDHNETEIKSDEEQNPVSCNKIIDRGFIKGNSFDICTGGRVISLKYVNEYNSRKFSMIKDLAVRFETRRRKKYLLINPGGSYRTSPSDYYSGVREQFCMALDIK